MSGGDQERRGREGGEGVVEWQNGMENGAHSSLGTSVCHVKDSEHDSLGMGLCTFNIRLHVNVPHFGQTGIGPG